MSASISFTDAELWAMQCALEVDISLREEAAVDDVGDRIENVPWDEAIDAIVPDQRAALAKVIFARQRR